MESERGPGIRLRACCVLTVIVVAVGGIGAVLVRDLAPQDYELVPGSVDLLPSFPASPSGIVVSVPAETSHGLSLALVSLQGLVNRQGARIFLETENEGNLSFLLPFIEARYPVSFTRISTGDFLRNFSSAASGIVVYDPSRLDTVNLATVIAGLDDYIMVDPSAASEVAFLTGLSVKADLRDRPWAGLSPLQLYRKSFNELYPRTNPNLLAILEPDKIWLRDYVIAARVWTFYARQGPFTSQENMDFTEEILSSTPHNIPILGWFETPNVIEENFFVQAASRHGKSILGGHNVPNISFLSGLTPADAFRQRRIVPPLPELKGDGIYVSFAVPDGDNLDFATSKMLDMWKDPVRGTIPLAWSINPQLAELAPPLLDYYYSNASLGDSFVAGPSGAGYLYPGYLRARDLEQYLIRTKKAIETADLDVVWLLNSFKAYEIPYSERTLDAYVDALDPRGLLLDYADQAVTRDAWIQGGEKAAAPVIRSTHLWSGLDNLAGKVMMDIDASPSKPHFFLVTVYPWSLKLGDAVKAIELLRARYGSRVSAVSVETIMALLGESFAKEAKDAANAARANPLSLFDPWDRDSAEALLDQAERERSAGDFAFASFHSYAALEHARRAIAVGTLLLLIMCGGVVGSILGGLHAFARKGLRSESVDRTRHLGRLASVLATVVLFYLFFGGLGRALEYNFWTYASVFVAGASLFFVPRMQSWIQKIQGEHSWLIEIAVMAVSGLCLLFEPWAFVPFAGAVAMLLSRLMRPRMTWRGGEAVFMGAGLVVSTVVRLDAMSLVASTAILVGLAYILNPQAPIPVKKKPMVKTAGVSFVATVLALQVIWIALIQNRYFYEKAEAGGELLFGLAVLALVAAPVVGLVVWRLTESRKKVDSLLILTASTALWIVLWISHGVAVFAVLVLSIAVMVSWSYLLAVNRVVWTDYALAKFIPRLLILCMIVIVLVRMPAIVYSLYIAKFPLPIEYILYTPALLMIFATLDIVQTEALVRLARKPAEKSTGTKP